MKVKLPDKMGSSAEEWLACPVIMDLWRSEKMVINRYMEGLGKNDMVLDLACGTGFTTDYVATKYACSAVGSDLVPDMIDTARANYGSDKVQFFSGNMCDHNILEDKKGMFTWVMCHHGLHMVVDTRGFLETARVALRQGGHLLINTITRQFGGPLFTIAFHKAIQDNKWKEYRQKLEEATNVPLFVETPAVDHWIRDTDVLVRLVEMQGFSIVHKEISLEAFTSPANRDMMKGVFSCVKKLPEERREEFVEDASRYAREISGQADPTIKFNTVVIVAKKK